MNGSQNSPEQQPPGMGVFLTLCLAILIGAVVVRILGLDLSLENFIHTIF